MHKMGKFFPSHKFQKAELISVGALKMQDWKMQDWKITDLNLPNLKFDGLECDASASSNEADFARAFSSPAFSGDPSQFPLPSACRHQLTTHTGLSCIARCACLHSIFRWHLHVALTPGGMARLS